MCTVCVSIVLYADAILLIAPSVSGLQTLLNVCETELINIDMSINQNQSVCIRFGPRFNAHCEQIISVSGVKFEWVDNFRYLSIFLSVIDSSDAPLKPRRVYFLLRLTLFSARLEDLHQRRSLLICIPVLLYGVEVCPFLYVKNMRLTFH